MKTKSLKAGIGFRYITPMVSGFIALAVLSAPTAFSWQSAIQHASFAGLLGLAVLALQELPTRAVKEALVHWRLRDRLPGCRAFSYHAQHDHRIDMVALAKTLSSIPQTPREQNAIWYGWLKQTEDAVEVADAHRRYLILRDTSVVSLILAFASLSLLALPSRPIESTAILFVLCIGTYAVLSAAARSIAAKLVTTVIAIKLSRQDSSKAKSSSKNASAGASSSDKRKKR